MKNVISAGRSSSRSTAPEKQPASRLSDEDLLSVTGGGKKLRFSPTKLSGQPVKVTGVIQYNFVAQ